MDAELKPRIFKGLQADFTQAEWRGENTSGLRAFGKNVLIRMDECAEATTGGVLLPQANVESLTAASETGVIYDIGPAAFRHFDDGAPWTGDRPEIGERVYIVRYSGVLAKGRDGAVYRAMDYSCIVAGLSTEELMERSAQHG